MGSKILILIIILFAALAISMSYPFFRGIQEGLTSAELASNGSIKTALQTYTNTVESNCQAFINNVTSLNGLEQTDSLGISPIIGNTSTTNSAKFQSIVSLNSSTPSITEAIAHVQGKNFTALMTLLQTLPTSTSDEQFNNIVTQQKNAVGPFTNQTNMSSPYYIINTYVQNGTPSS